MKSDVRWSVACFALLLTSLSSAVRAEDAPADDRLTQWKTGVVVRPLCEATDRHTLHAYYVCNPESPDGSRVVFYSSKAVNGHVGDVCVIDRTSGKETVLAREVHTEDAHRGACQQFVCGGSKVAFHDVRDGQWMVVCVDIESGKETILAKDHQLGFGATTGDWLPIYGCHWKPGPFRDFELVNAKTGETKTVIKATDVESAHSAYLQKQFGGKPISIFFPVLSPDYKRAFFKLAAGSGGDNFMSKAASSREGLLFCDVTRGKLMTMREHWGHPAWHPDSHLVIEMGNILIDSESGAVRRIPDQPYLRGTHPSVSPDGKLFATDGLGDTVGAAPGEWAVMVGDLRGKYHQVLHKFDNSHGARSWRVNHPHPVFSADSRRVYFNVNSGPWTQLFVAEANPSLAGK